jgi:lipoprotein-releasing system ATP-binding protein
MSIVLEAQEITKTFFSPEPLQILKGVSLKARQGESLAIIGRSGSGKSSLLHILGTLDKPTSGKVLFPNIPASSSNEHIRRQEIGFVFQSFHLLEDYTLLENVTMPLRVARKTPTKHAESLLDQVGLLDKKDTPLKLLSGGEKQRASLARALCNNPSILLVDEPTGSLDNLNAKIVQNLLLDCCKKQNKTLILVTHDQDFAALCDTTYTLKEGLLT